jgi:hypothetical protein
LINKHLPVVANRSISVYAILAALLQEAAKENAETDFPNMQQFSAGWGGYAIVVSRGLANLFVSLSKQRGFK